MENKRQSRVLGGASSARVLQEQQAQRQGSASNISVNIPGWMDSNMIRSMCGVSEDEQAVLQAGQGPLPVSPMSQPSPDSATPCRAAAAPAQRGLCPQM